MSGGGLAGPFAESCFATEGAGVALPVLGANVRLDDLSPAEAALFNERGARAVVSVAPSKLAAVLDTARQYNVAARKLGQVTRDSSFRIEHKGRTVVGTSLTSHHD